MGGTFLERGSRHVYENGKNTPPFKAIINIEKKPEVKVIYFGDRNIATLILLINERSNLSDDTKNGCVEEIKKKRKQLSGTESTSEQEISTMTV